MKTIFDATKIATMCGLYIIRESASKPFKDIGFARTVTFKICYSVKNHTYHLCNILTDGCLIGEYKTTNELIEHLNNDEKGYRPLTKEEMWQMLKETNQGFY